MPVHVNMRAFLHEVTGLSACQVGNQALGSGLALEDMKFPPTTNGDALSWRLQDTILGRTLPHCLARK